jgi:predicted O-methyltransferase YrrM
MHEKFTALTPPLYEYLLRHNPPQDDVQAALAEETAALGPVSMMQIAVEQGVFLTWLTRLLGVRFAVEVGTFTGYSALSIARGLPPGGRLLCCDVSEEWTGIARRHWERAKVADRIELRIAPAIDTLKALPRTTPVDLAFIDADKTSYRAYYEELLPRLSPNGVIVFDNVLWGGSVVNPDKTDESTVAIRALNDFVVSDARVDAVMLPVADGITLVRRRAS